jgi:pimeloyl-ACP methyl ester carboxylesterase
VLVTRVLPVGTPEHAVLDVVFIHGLDGDARKTWSRKEKESFWPKWLAEEFVDVAVWTVDHDAWSSGWRGRSMPMQDRAVNLMTQLQNHGIGERPLCFVTHSMGGLLAKEILLHAADARTEFAVFAAETKGVVFLATPHTGAGLTKAVEALGVLYRGTPAISDLEHNQPYLRHLNDRYRNWVDEVKVQNLVFFETHRTSGMRVVDETSANPGLAGVTRTGHTTRARIVVLHGRLSAAGGHGHRRRPNRSTPQGPCCDAKRTLLGMSARWRERASSACEWAYR